MCFIASDAKSILNIMLGSPTFDNAIYYGFDLKGFFSVKSAYHLAISLNEPKEALVLDEFNMKKCWNAYGRLRSFLK